jgi:hypothetical protein
VGGVTLSDEMASSKEEREVFPPYSDGDGQPQI